MVDGGRRGGRWVEIFGTRGAGGAIFFFFMNYDLTTKIKYRATPTMLFMSPYTLIVSVVFAQGVHCKPTKPNKKICI